ncbi:hypothetical protein [Solidesulfovibrio sp.]|uniref:hypothetical protein n=1 Tax=Solidesulfovibrio sp. TaxID=2910990 RepID=UPI002636B3AC|nr:hypothetical protein [Solidesulfovibrio sp.]
MQKYCFLIGLVVFIFGASPSARAELNYKGTIAVGQEYNDNVNETSHPRSDFVSLLSPAIQAEYSASRFLASVDYQGELRIYDNGQRQNEMINNLEAKLNLQLIKDLLAVEATDSNHMVFTNAAQGQTRAADSTADQTNQNISTFAAILTPRITDRTQARLGVMAKEDLYSGGSDTVNKNINAAFADLLHEMTDRLEVGVSVRGERQFTEQRNLNRYIASVVGRYTYKQDCFVYGRIGAVETIPDDASVNLMPTWSAGLTHSFGRTAVILESQGDYVDNPTSVYDSFRALYTATVTHAFDRAKVTANAGYSDFSGPDTQHSNDFTLSAQLEYELTARLAALVSASRVDTITSNNSVQRVYGTAEVRYELPKEFELKGYYRLKLNDSYNSDSSTYHVNIVGLALTKRF